jgi:hypothetical protein
MLSKIIDGTFVAAALYLVLSQADSFGTVVGAVSNGYSTAVRALQGRN